MNAQRQYKVNTTAKRKSTEKLSSGYKINRAADDAAGLTISEKMRSQIRGLSQGVNNCQDGVSLCQVADGAMAEVDDMLHRMNELCIQAANGTNTSADREAIDKEIQQLKTEVDRIGNETEFNEIKVLQGTESVETGEYETIKTTEIQYHEETQKKLVEKERPVQVIDYDGQNDNLEYYWGKKQGVIYKWQNPTSYHTINTVKCTVDFSKFKTQEDWAKMDNTWLFISCPYYLKGDGTDRDDAIRFVFDNSKTGITDMNPDYNPYKKPYQTRTLIVGTANYINGEDFLKDVYSYAKSLSSKFSAEKTVFESEKTSADLGHQMHFGMSSTELYLYYETRQNIEYIKEQTKDSEIKVGGWTLKDTYEKYYEEEDVTVLVPEYVEVEKEVPVKKEINKDIPIQYANHSYSRFLLKLPHIDCDALDMNGISAKTSDEALASIDMISDALAKVNEQRSMMGAQQNGIEALIRDESATVENTQAAESRIRDTDMASEMVTLTKQNILIQIGESIMSQANQNPQSVLSLIS